MKFERMPCKSRNRGQFRGNVNKYRCTLVSRAMVPGYGLVVSLPAQSPYSVLPPPLSLLPPSHPPSSVPSSLSRPEINMKLVCNPDSLRTVDARK